MDRIYATAFMITGGAFLNMMNKIALIYAIIVVMATFGFLGLMVVSSF